MGRKETRKGEVAHALDRFLRETGWAFARALAGVGAGARSGGRPPSVGWGWGWGAERIVAVCGSLRVLRAPGVDPVSSNAHASCLVALKAELGMEGR